MPVFENDNAKQNTGQSYTLISDNIQFIMAKCDIQIASDKGKK